MCGAWCEWYTVSRRSPGFQSAIWQRGASELERCLSHHVRGGERRVHAAGVELTCEAQVVAELGMDDGCGRVQSGRHIGGGGQLFPVDLQVRQCVLGQGPGLRDDGHHRFALPARALQRQRVLRRRLHSRQVRQRGHPRATDGRDLCAVDHGDHARHGLRGCALDPADAAVRDRRAPVHDVHHARQRDVVDERAATFGQPPGARARGRRTDVARVVRHRMQLRRVPKGCVHRAAEPLAVSAAARRACITSQTASTIA
jgi:hypothetical protein